MATQAEQLEAIKQQALAIQATLNKGLDTGYGPGIQPTTIDTTQQDRLYSKLLAQNDIVSSEASGIERLISQQTSSLQKAQDARDAGTKAFYERQRTDLGNTFAQQVTGSREALNYAGAASTVAVMQQMEEQHTKNLRDLDLREKEALAIGQIETASKIADLKLQQIQFTQQARQQAFNNLLSLGNFAASMQDQRLKVAQLNLSERQFGLQTAEFNSRERQAMANIALQYGVALKEGDTIDTVVARATPFASQRQQLELQKLRADIAQSNAATAASLRSGTPTSDGIDLSIIGALLKKNPNDPYAAELFKNLKPAQQATVLGYAAAKRQYTDEELRGLARQYKTNDVDLSGALLDATGNGDVSNMDRAQLVFSEIYGKSAPAPKSSSSNTGSTAQTAKQKADAEYAARRAAAAAAAQKPIDWGSLFGR